MNADATNDTDRKFEIFKLEYERAAERYENIYKAVWQNFSYMSALAAGIVAFGSQALPLTLVAALALIPLVFWFYATFVPMDRYGQLTRARLGFIEAIINDEFLQNAGEVVYTDEKIGEIRAPKQMGHYQRFYGGRRGYRVRTAVVIFGIAVTLALGYLSFRYFTDPPTEHKPDTLELRVSKPLELKVSEPSEPIEVRVQNP